VRFVRRSEATNISLLANSNKSALADNQVLDIHGKKVPQQPHHAFNTSLLPLQTSK
jgi:hypothetical protein